MAVADHLPLEQGLRLHDVNAHFKAAAGVVDQLPSEQKFWLCFEGINNPTYMKDLFFFPFCNTLLYCLP